jgi:hypothetical protein
MPGVSEGGFADRVAAHGPVAFVHPVELECVSRWEGSAGLVRWFASDPVDQAGWDLTLLQVRRLPELNVEGVYDV